MAKRKTIEHDVSVVEFIDSIEEERKRDDCRAIAGLMAKATGEMSRMWGSSIVGFGTHHYQYANGKPGTICKVGFAPRARSFAFYLCKCPENDLLIDKLGKHKYSGGCLHVTRLSDVDENVLVQMIKNAFRSDGGPC